MYKIFYSRNQPFPEYQYPLTFPIPTISIIAHFYPIRKANSGKYEKFVKNAHNSSLLFL